MAVYLDMFTSCRRRKSQHLSFMVSTPNKQQGDYVEALLLPVWQSLWVLRLLKAREDLCSYGVNKNRMGYRSKRTVHIRVTLILRLSTRSDSLVRTCTGCICGMRTSHL